VTGPSSGCPRAHQERRLTDDAIDVLPGCDARRPNPESVIAVRTLGGATDRVTADESAYPHRGARFNVSFDAAWSNPDDDRMVRWSRESWTVFRPHATGGVYVNFAGFDDEADMFTTDTLGTAARLAEVMATFDPDGLCTAASRRP
jgi:hypothetical protein